MAFQLGTISQTIDTTTYNMLTTVPKEMLEQIKFYDISLIPKAELEISEDEVTHEVFFGENIKRVLNILRSK